MKKLLVIVAILIGHQLYGASNTISVYPANTLMLSNAIAGLGAIITNLFEPKITGATTNDYWSGAKTWINFTNSVANYWNYRTTISNYWSALNTFANGLNMGGSSITNLNLINVTNTIQFNGTNINTTFVGEGTNMYYTWDRVAAMLNSNYINVKYPPYNAKGDGSTDDTAAIGMAIATGRPLFFPNGTYKTTSALVFTNSFQSLLGCGSSTLRYMGTGVVDKAFYFKKDPLYNWLLSINIDKINFMGNSNVNNLLYLENVIHSKVKDCIIVECPGVSMTMWSNVLVSVDNVKISPNEMGPSYTLYPNIGLYMYYTWASKLDNIISEYCTNGIYLDLSTDNTFISGTSEHHFNTGLVLTNNSLDNTFLNFECEDIPTDWPIQIVGNSFANRFEGGTIGEGVYCDTASMQMFGTDVKGVYLSANSSYCNLFGVRFGTHGGGSAPYYQDYGYQNQNIGPCDPPVPELKTNIMNSIKINGYLAGAVQVPESININYSITTNGIYSLSLLDVVGECFLKDNVGVHILFVTNASYMNEIFAGVTKVNYIIATNGLYSPSALGVDNGRVTNLLSVGSLSVTNSAVLNTLSASGAMTGNYATFTNGIYTPSGLYADFAYITNALSVGSLSTPTLNVGNLTVTNTASLNTVVASGAMTVNYGVFSNGLYSRSGAYINDAIITNTLYLSCLADGPLKVTGGLVSSDATYLDVGAAAASHTQSASTITNGTLQGAIGVSSDFTIHGNLMSSNLIRFQNQFTTIPSGASGVGGELFVTSGGVYFQAYNRTASSMSPIYILGSPINLGTDTGIAFLTAGELSTITTIDWSIIASTPLTLAGYGITNAYTKQELQTGGSAAVNWNNLTSVPTTFTPAPHNQSWSTITNTPTSISGYGITDAYTKTELQTSGSSSVHWDNITDKPSSWVTNLPPDVVDWNDITNKPSTFPPSAHDQDWSTITNKPSAYPPDSHTHPYSEISDLNSWEGNTNLTTLGTIAAGTWHGTVIESDYLGSHIHSTNDVTGLTAQMQSRSPTNHTHSIYAALNHSILNHSDVSGGTVDEGNILQHIGGVWTNQPMPDIPTTNGFITGLGSVNKIPYWNSTNNLTYSLLSVSASTNLSVPGAITVHSITVTNGGNIEAGTGVTLSGDTTNRLVGSGNITITATAPTQTNFGQVVLTKQTTNLLEQEFSADFTEITLNTTTTILRINGTTTNFTCGIKGITGGTDGRIVHVINNVDDGTGMYSYSTLKVHINAPTATATNSIVKFPNDTDTEDEDVYYSGNNFYLIYDGDVQRWVIFGTPNN